MRSPQGGLSAGSDGQQVIREATPQVDILGSKCRCWGGVPHGRYGTFTWTHLANGEVGCANGAPGLSLFHCSVPDPHRGGKGKEG